MEPLGIPQLGISDKLQAERMNHPQCPSFGYQYFVEVKGDFDSERRAGFPGPRIEHRRLPRRGHCQALGQTAQWLWGALSLLDAAACEKLPGADALVKNFVDGWGTHVGAIPMANRPARGGNPDARSRVDLRTIWSGPVSLGFGRCCQSIWRPNPSSVRLIPAGDPLLDVCERRQDICVLG